MFFFPHSHRNIHCGIAMIGISNAVYEQIAYEMSFHALYA